MPFRNLQAAGAPQLEERYAADLPEPLVVAILDKDLEREGRTTAALVYGFVYSHPASGAEVVVKEQFLTDFASIPSIAQAVFQPFGRHSKAAVLHDWLYSVGEPRMKWFADQIFYDAMGELGVDDLRRRIMYQAVHLGGGGGYDNAARDWPTSWSDWRSGELLPQPPYLREAFFQAKWAKPPRPDYKPW